MSLEEIKNALLNKQLIISVLTVIISVMILMLFKRIINRRIKIIEKQKMHNYRKRKTYLKLLNHISNYVVIIFDLIFVLQIYGINVTSIVAGLGIVSIIVGLALQDAFKDIIMGFNIIVDNYFSIGDVIRIGDVEGKVLELGLKATKIKDINTDGILVIANRNITQALNISNVMDIDIPIGYNENTQKIEKIIDEIIIKVKENNNIEDAKYVGINKFGDSAIYYKIRLWCKPEDKFTVKRFVLRTIKLDLDKNEIEIPYMQVDVHNK